VPNIIKHTYRFFDQDIEVVADNTDILDLMDSMYREFRSDGADETGQKSVYEVLTSAHPDGKSLVRTGKRSYIVKDIKLLPSVAHGIILRRTLSRIRSHMLFHAAALSFNDKGIILVADSGYGKTTLSLALVRQGLRFLSDEIAALSLSNGELAPYPRCLWIRQGTAGVFNHYGWNYPDHSTEINIGDREAVYLSPQLTGSRCRLNYLIVIQPVREDIDDGTETPDISNERYYYVTVDSLDNGLIKELQSTTGTGEAIDPGHDLEGKVHSRFPVLKVRAGLLRRMYDVCEKYGVLIINAEEEDPELPFYDKSPEIRKMSKMNAAVELLKSFYGGHCSNLIQEDFHGSPAMLFKPLSRILDHAECYHLAPGRLDMMVEAIYNILK
jgi:hypothetical protein